MRVALLFLLFAIPLLLPAVQSVPGASGSPCETYHHQAVPQIAGVINAGDHEARAEKVGCGIARSPTQVFQWTAQYSGPVILVAATITWTVATAGVGCTLTTPTATSSVTAAGATSIAASTITMTSNECRGVYQLAVNIPTLHTWFALFAVNIYVPSQASYNFLCDATGTTSNAQDPDAATCNETGLDVDIRDDSTDDGFLSIPPTDISNITLNGTFPSELTVHADFPGNSENLGIDAWTTAIFWIAAVLFFSYMGWLIALAFAIPGLLSSMIPSVKSLLEGLGLDFEALFILCLMGFILELAANRFSWGGYTSGARRLRLVGA